MAYSESDTRAKLIDPAIHARGWTEDLICRTAALKAPGRPVAAPAETRRRMFAA